MNDCKLRAFNGIPGEECDRGSCVFWRVAPHLDLVEQPQGCALQYFELVGDREVALWLLSVKERLEAEPPGPAC